MKRWYRTVLVPLLCLLPAEWSAVWYSNWQRDPLYVQSGVGVILLGWAVVYLSAAAGFHYYEMRQERQDA